MFAIDVRQWRTIEEFTAHMGAHDPTIASWARGVVIHHTWKPTGGDWRGVATINSMARYYQSKGWTAGPHLFICTDAPNPYDRGIFQMTPLNVRGIHAGRFNATHWGIEVVGNFDVAPWDFAQTATTTNAAAILLRWRNLPADYSTIRGHRETGSPKTCPGRMVDMNAVRVLIRGLVDG